jgi:hypothetical protein
MPLLTGGIFYMPSGVSLNADEYNRLEQLPDIVHNHGVNHAARYLIALQRRVSLRTNVVGHYSMVVSIPAAPTNPHVRNERHFEHRHTRRKSELQLCSATLVFATAIGADGGR